MLAHLTDHVSAPSILLDIVPTARIWTWLRPCQLAQVVQKVASKTEQVHYLSLILLYLGKVERVLPLVLALQTLQVVVARSSSILDGPSIGAALLWTRPYVVCLDQVPLQKSHVYAFLEVVCNLSILHLSNQLVNITLTELIITLPDRLDRAVGHDSIASIEYIGRNLPLPPF